MKLENYKIKKETDNYGKVKFVLKFKKTMFGVPYYGYLRDLHYRKSVQMVTSLTPKIILFSVALNLISYSYVSFSLLFAISQVISIMSLVLISMYYLLEVTMYMDKIVKSGYRPREEDAIEYFQEKVKEINDLYDINPSDEIIYSTMPINKVKGEKFYDIKFPTFNIKEYIY